MNIEGTRVYCVFYRIVTKISLTIGGAKFQRSQLRVMQITGENIIVTCYRTKNPGIAYVRIFGIAKVYISRLWLKSVGHSRKLLNVHHEGTHSETTTLRADGKTRPV